MYNWALSHCLNVVMLTSKTASSFPFHLFFHPAATHEGWLVRDPSAPGSAAPGLSGPRSLP